MNVKVKKYGKWILAGFCFLVVAIIATSMCTNVKAVGLRVCTDQGECANWGSSLCETLADVIGCADSHLDNSDASDAKCTADCHVIDCTFDGTTPPMTFSIQFVQDCTFIPR